MKIKALTALGVFALATTANAQLYDNGPVITGFGTHPTGADVSLLQSDSLGMNSLGGNVTAGSFSMADDFSVSDSAGWSVDSFQFYGYQTNSGIPSTFTAAYVQIYDGAPNDGGSVIWGDMTTNIMSSTEWTGAYRVSEGSFSSEARPLMSITADTSGLELGAGDYWVEVSLDGSASSGPWMPPITIEGETTTGNALQSTSDGWQDWLDSGTETPQGMPFLMDGSVIPAPGALALLGLAGLAGARRRRN